MDVREDEAINKTAIVGWPHKISCNTVLYYIEYEDLPENKTDSLLVTVRYIYKFIRNCNYNFITKHEK